MGTNSMGIGHNFDEVLRVPGSCQRMATHKVAALANWKQGNDVIIVPAVSGDAAKDQHSGGCVSPKPYIRIALQSD